MESLDKEIERLTELRKQMVAGDRKCQHCGNLYLCHISDFGTSKATDTHCADCAWVLGVTKNRPTDEELRIAPKLPVHLAQKGDLIVHHTLEKKDRCMSVITEIRNDILVSSIILYGDKISGEWQERWDRYGTRYDVRPSQIIAWLAHPHQIMAMDEWPEDWFLRCDAGQVWQVSEITVDVNKPHKTTAKLIASGKTARLACLRAIETRLA